jgi:hypothetical protein
VLRRVLSADFPRKDSGAAHEHDHRRTQTRSRATRAPPLDRGRCGTHTRQQKRTKSDLVRDILRRHTGAELFREARRRMKPYAEKAGYLTDEEFFRDFS